MKNHSGQLRWLLMLVMVFTLTFGFASTAYAFENIEDGDLPAGEVVDDDLFIFGETVVVDGTVNGDLFAFGNTVVVNGTVNGSLFSGAQTVTVNGTVSGSVYTGTSYTQIGSSAEIGRNLFFGGFALDIQEGASISQDIAVGGYQAVVNGKIGRDLYAGAGALEINGAVGGDVRADVEGPTQDMGPTPYMPFTPPGAPAMLPSGLRISENAQIGGQIAYTSPVDQGNTIETDPAGGVVFSTPVPDTTPGYTPEVSAQFNVGRWLLQRAREFFTLLVLGGFVLWLLPNLLNKVVAKVQSEPLPSTGWGFVTIIVGYAGAVVAAGLVLALAIFFGVLTLGGLGRSIFGVGFSSLGLTMAIFVLLISYGSKLVVAFWGGKWILSKLAPQAAESKIWPLVLGVVLYVLLRAIPVLGWVIGVIVTLLGLGAMWLVFREWQKPVVAGEVVAVA